MIYPLHEKAKALAKTYLSTETELIDCLKQIFEQKIFEKLGYASMHDYATLALGLSKDRAYTLTQIARKYVEIPELQIAIEESGLSVSNARMLLPVLKKENSPTLIKSALTLSNRKLKRELVRTFPDKMIQERIRPISENRSELRTGISQELEKKIERVKDLVSQKLKKSCSLEEALSQMAELYLKTQDPLRKAERAMQKKRNW